jgi:hypothetical protein
MFLWQFFVIGVGKIILKRNSPLILLKYMASVQRITLPMSSLLYMDLNPYSREEEYIMKHPTPLRGHGDNKIPICLQTLLHNIHNNNGYLPCLILNGHHNSQKSNIGNKDGEGLHMGMLPFIQQIFPPTHNTLQIFLNCSHDFILLIFLHPHSYNNNFHFL